MKRILAALLTTAGLVTGAYAADFVEPMPVVAPPPPPVATWTGFYVGGHVGYGWGESSLQNDNNNEDVDPEEEFLENGIEWVEENCFFETDGAGEPYDVCGPPLDNSGDPEGLLGGLQFGFDWQMTNFVFGLVADAALTGINGELEKDIERGPPTSFETSYDWIATFRARAGWLLTPQALLYIHGGLAAADIRIENLNTGDPQALGDLFHDDVSIGYVIGVGGEYRMDENLSIFAEYGFMDFGDFDGSWEWDEDLGEELLAEGSFSGDNELHVVKVGFNWRPDWMFGP